MPKNEIVSQNIERFKISIDTTTTAVNVFFEI